MSEKKSMKDPNAASDRNYGREAAPADGGSYVPINADKSKWDADLNSLKEVYANDPYHNQAYETDALLQQMQNAGINTDSFGYRSQQGGYTQNRDEAITGGGSGAAVSLPGKDGVWYEKPGVDRQEAAGTSRADEDHLNDTEYAYVQYCKEQYAKAATQEERDYWHNEAEKTRARYGYSGGSDGSTYYTLGQLGAHSPYDDIPAGNGGYEMSKSEESGSSDPSSELKAMLDAWKQTAVQQSNAQIDYAVQKAVTDLERALADAQPQFKEQAESVDRSARQAMDNSALYAELRGDKGGIGGEQYNAIQNAQAQNHLAVQQAQTRLATDTWRQIEDLRAQGEFEKADAALAITQSYLKELVALEQWAAEYDLDVDRFNASLAQWEAEYSMAMQKLGLEQSRWQQEFDYARETDSRKQLSAAALAMLEAGIPLTEAQMAAMGITAEQAGEYVRIFEPSKNTTSGGKDDSSGDMDYAGLFAAAEESGYAKSFIANNYKKYGFTSATGLYDDYRDWLAMQGEKGYTLNESSVLALGLGPLSQSEVMGMVITGVLEVDGVGSGATVRWADGWNAERYRREDAGSGLV